MSGRWLVGAFVLAMVAASPARCDLLPSMEISAGFDGIMRPGHVVPVTVEVANPGVGLRGQVVVSRPGGKLQSRRDVELPSGSRKVVTVYMDAGDYDSSLEVSLRGVMGLTLAEATVEMDAIESGHPLAVVVGSEVWGLRRFADDEERPLQVAMVDATGAPDRWYGWDAADVVVWPERAGAPSPDAARALTRWVELGGTLVLALGSDGRGLGELLPLSSATVAPGAAVDRSAILDALGLQREAGAADAGRVPVSDLSLSGGASVLYEDAAGRPLVVEAYHGLGRVVTFAFDPAVARLAAAGGSDGLFAELLPIPDASPIDVSNQRGDLTLQTAERFVIDIPPLRPISLSFLLAFMTAYVLVVGPIDYLVLKRLGRMTLTWVTYPTAIVVFSLVAYAFASSMKGGTMVVTSLEILDAVAGAGSARRTSMMGIFAVDRRTYEVTTEAPDGYVSWQPSRFDLGQAGLFFGGAEAAKDDDGVHAALQLPISTFTQEKVFVREVVPERPAGLRARLEEKRTGESPMPLGGEHDLIVENAGERSLRGIAVIGSGGRVVELGDLEPGQKRRLSEAREARQAATLVGGRLHDAGPYQTGNPHTWHIEREAETLTGVDRAVAKAFAVGITAPQKSGVVAATRWLGGLDLTARLDAGAFVVIAHEVENGPSPLRVDAATPRCQTLRIHRLVVDGAVSPEEGES